MQIASFDLLPMDLIYDEFFTDVPDSANSNLENEGFGTTLILYNLGSMIIAILSFPVLTIYACVLKFFIPCCKGPVKVYCKKKREDLQETLYWSQPIVTYTESYAVLSMCTLINLRFVSPDLNPITFFPFTVDGIRRVNDSIDFFTDNHPIGNPVYFACGSSPDSFVLLGTSRWRKNLAEIRSNLRTLESWTGSVGRACACHLFTSEIYPCSDCRLPSTFDLSVLSDGLHHHVLGYCYWTTWTIQV